MTPADQFLLDGDHAWWVKSKLWFAGATADVTDLDCPCERCYGVGTILVVGEGEEPCPAKCIGGRHTFDLDVGCVCGGTDMGLRRDGGCHLCYGTGVLTHRVSVAPGMVLPIVGSMCPQKTNEQQHNHVHLGEGMTGICWFDSDLVWDSPWHSKNLIQLPPGAAPGMWVVKLSVANSRSATPNHSGKPQAPAPGATP